MKVILLGTGGPRPGPGRAATTTLIRVGDDNVLFDAGRGVVVQMAKAPAFRWIASIRSCLRTTTSITSATFTT
jgi:hypothetical protein